MKGQTVDILKDDGCNTNVMSSSFIKKHGHLLTLKKDNLSITHSENKTTETATQLVVDAEVRIGAHRYRSNFAVVNCRYDILLGMPWNKSENPSVDYAGKKVRVDGMELPRRPSPEKLEAGITNLSIKKFRSLVREHGAKEDFELYHVVPVLRKREKGKAVLNNVELSDVDRLINDNPKHTRLANLLKKYESVFRSELPQGLPPKRSIDHEIETEKGAKPPKRSLFQLSPA